MIERFLKRVVLIVVIAGPILFAGWAWIALHFVYAKGQRAGYVQKISQKGWLCKTWEGELAMANLPGAMPEIFRFSVRDDAVAREVERLSGNRVNLSYEYHAGVPTACFGETGYFITKITPVVDDVSSRPPAALK